MIITQRLKTPDLVKTENEKEHNIVKLLRQLQPTDLASKQDIGGWLWKVCFDMCEILFFENIKTSGTLRVGEWLWWLSTTPRAILRDAMLQMCLLLAAIFLFADVKIKLYSVIFFFPKLLHVVITVC